MLSGARDLILVDDRAIRMSHYNHVNKTLKKIEKLEKDILRFESVDQKHFQDWLNLTFNNTLKEHQTILDEYRKIAQLHNQVRAESEMTNTSMFDAFRMIDYENSIYETATPDKKSDRQKKTKKN